jgi:hypothetical protein
MKFDVGGPGFRSASSGLRLLAKGIDKPHKSLKLTERADKTVEQAPKSKVAARAVAAHGRRRLEQLKWR